MFIPDWLQPTFLLAPALLWMFFGVGVPWALAILPRADWKRRIEVAAVALALGPALTTTAMFLLGTFGHWTQASILLISAWIALIGLIIALRRNARGTPTEEAKADPPLTTIDWALMAAIGVAIVLRFWNTAYWPYDNYDEFWVYGYNAKIFTMQAAIPASIGYYPQLLPLSLTYGQLMWGGLNEHAARTVVPYFGMGSILIVYVLGARLFGRRMGLSTAAIWALYAHAAGWAQYADLEVPVTFFFTGAAAYCILAWQTADKSSRRRHAILGGLFAGAALWTKPTAGALIDSVALIGAIVAVQAFFSNRLQSARIRLQTAIQSVLKTPMILFGIALLPMGVMWYVRNILFGHPPLVYPASYWQLAAQRSGQELGWPLLILGLLTLYLLWRSSITDQEKRGLLGGYALMLIGALPSAMDAHHLGLIEFAVIGIGLALWLWSARGWWKILSARTRSIILLLYGFILPYFVTWFWSYSYHYRLSFAIVPLFAVQVGAIAVRLLSPVIDRRRVRVALATATILVGAIPGWVAAMSAWGYVQTNALPDDHAKQAIANPALLTLVDFLNVHRPVGRPLRVAAPGELRLPYFFPTDDIRTDYPLWLDQIADVDFFVDSSVGQRLYREQGIDPSYVQVLASLTRDPVFKWQMSTDDGNFRFTVYSVNNAARFTAPKPNGPTPGVQVGDFARLLGYDLSTLQNAPNTRVFLTLYWQAIKPSSIDYSVYVHFWDPQAQRLGGVWGGEPVSGEFSAWDGVPGTHVNVPYHTRLWQAGEYIKDEWILTIPKDTLPGQYQLRVGLFDPIGGQRLPVTKDGQPAGDGVVLNIFTVLPSG